MNHDNRFQRSARILRFASPGALATLALVLALAGCVRDEQPATALMGDSTGTQTPQPPGSSPPSTTPPTTTPPADNHADAGRPDHADHHAADHGRRGVPADALSALARPAEPLRRLPRRDADPDVRGRRRDDRLQRDHDAAEGRPRESAAVARLPAPGLDRHNCGGNAACDAIAADFLAAIQQWAQLRPAPPPPNTAGADERGHELFARHGL